MPIPETASKVFELMFTLSFMDMIVKQSNLYAKQVMGDEKYASWEKITREELRILHFDGNCSPSSAR